MAPALIEKQVAASAFHSPPELNTGDQVGGHSQRKSYSQLASGQTMHTRTELTTCSTASHFHICTRVKGPASDQRLKKYKKGAILSNGGQDKREMGWYTIKYYKPPELQHQTQKQIGASSCHGPELFSVPRCGRMCAGGWRGTSRKDVSSYPRYLDAEALQRTLLAFAVPHRRVRFHSACAPVLLHIITSNCLALNHTKAEKSSRTPCVFRAVCPLRLGSSQPSA